MEGVTEAVTEVTASELLLLLQHIDGELNILLHLCYLGFVLLAAYALYLVYTFVFRRFI